MGIFTGNGVKLSYATKPQHFKINTIPSKTFVSVLLCHSRVWYEPCHQDHGSGNKQVRQQNLSFEPYA